MKLSSSVNIAGIKFGNALMNGAYINSKNLKDINALVSSAAGAVVVGSISVQPRNKNPGKNYWLHKEHFFSLNSYGLPNGGIPYFKEALPKMVKIAHSEGKPLVANVIGFSNSEFVELVGFAEESGADVVELNFGCPNVWDGVHQKRIISYHASLVKDALSFISKQSPKIKISVKISPLPPDILQEVSKAIIDSGIVQIVTATNTYPNAAITSGAKDNKFYDDKLVGLAGRALKPISLGVVKQLRSLLPKDIYIIGAGGISTATDVKDYISAGASAVQIATALKEDGPSVFAKILHQE
ncbi:MAG TPA: hypothetical protein VMR34_00285 [Candidatus Saccharimonadales bacterium]|nr:hypothetical protein [Candidatus Saccharimonadales bacterium]